MTMVGRKLLLTFWLALVSSPSGFADPPRKLLLLGQGPDGHPPQSHEYMAGLRVLAKCLKPVAGLEVSLVQADGRWKEGPELLGRADGVVLYLAEGARWVAADPQRREAFRKLAARGGGIVGLHWAIGTREAGPIQGFLQLLGGCHGGPDRKYKELEADVRLVDPRHPILSGVTEFRVLDEFYYRLKFPPAADNIQPLLRVPIEGRLETLAWAWQRPDGGRSFGFSGLHFHKNWGLEAYLRLVAQGVLWTLKLPIPAKGLPVVVIEEDLKLK
jgi:hypothetical protein